MKPGTRRTCLTVVGSLSVLLFSACASLKAPTLRVDKLRFGKVGITGVELDVSFGLRNTNPEDLLVERFEYDLVMNGHRLGRGYFPGPVELPGFAEQGVVSEFNLNLLQLPGGLKAILDQDRVRARVSGTFYVRRRDSLKKLHFSSDAEVPLDR
jgi:LEA14-like dessication related protein